MDLIRQRLATATGNIKTELAEEICPGHPNLQWLRRSAADDQHLSDKYGNTYMAYQRRL